MVDCETDDEMVSCDTDEMVVEENDIVDEMKHMYFHKPSIISSHLPSTISLFISFNQTLSNK